VKFAKLMICMALCFCCLGCHYFVNAAEEPAAFDEFAQKYKSLVENGAEALDELTGGRSTEYAGKLAEELEKCKPEELSKDLRALLDVTATMSDEELKESISQMSEKYSISLKEEQLDALVKLCRKLENFSMDELKAKLTTAKESGRKLAETGKTAAKTVSAVMSVLNSVRGALSRVLTGLKNFLESVRNIF